MNQFSWAKFDKPRIKRCIWYGVRSWACAVPVDYGLHPNAYPATDRIGVGATPREAFANWRQKDTPSAVRLAQRPLCKWRFE